MGLLGGIFGLGRKVEQAKRSMVRVAGEVATEPVIVSYYGAFDLDPGCLSYWVCVQTDAERDRLRQDASLKSRLRATLNECGYPREARAKVFIDFESQETVDRESNGNWFEHWR